MSPCIVTAGTPCARSWRARRVDGTLRVHEDEREPVGLLVSGELDQLVQLLVRRRPARTGGRPPPPSCPRIRSRGGRRCACTRRRSARPRRRAWPRRTSSDGPWAAAERCDRPAAGIPCRACGRPRRARRSARRRARTIRRCARSSSRPGVAMRMCTSPTPLDCSLTPRSAVDGLDLQALGLRDVAEVVAHLGGELTGRHEDERLRPARRRWVELLDDGDREPERLARAGLRLRERVATRRRVLDHHAPGSGTAASMPRAASVSITTSETPRSRNVGVDELICPQG